MAEYRGRLAVIVVFAVIAVGAVILSSRDHSPRVDRRVKQYEQCIEKGGTNATCPSP